jgi:hypothetical protein
MTTFLFGRTKIELPAVQISPSAGSSYRSPNISVGYERQLRKHKSWKLSLRDSRCESHERSDMAGRSPIRNSHTQRSSRLSSVFEIQIVDQ